MDLSRTIAEINGDFSQKSQNFSHRQCILHPHWRGSPRRLGLDIFSRVDTIHQRDGRTDARRQQRPRLRMASRGKN